MCNITPQVGAVHSGAQSAFCKRGGVWALVSLEGG
jgi:hypothetical protein